MLQITGTVQKKETRKNTRKVDLIIKDRFNNNHSFQVRPSALYKVVEVDTCDKVKITYKNEVKKFCQSSSNVKILKDVEIIKKAVLA